MQSLIEQRATKTTRFQIRWNRSTTRIAAFVCGPHRQLSRQIYLRTRKCSSDNDTVSSFIKSQQPVPSLAASQCRSHGVEAKKFRMCQVKDGVLWCSHLDTTSLYATTGCITTDAAGSPTQTFADVTAKLCCR